jgi:hypothetical protein
MGKLYQYLSICLAQEKLKPCQFSGSINLLTAGGKPPENLEILHGDRT